MNIAETAMAARIRGMSYGQYTYLLGLGRVEAPPIEEIRARLKRKKERKGGARAQTPVMQYDKNGEFVASYENAAAAARAFGRDYPHTVYAACDGRYLSAWGYQWRYAGDEAPGKYQRINTHPERMYQNAMVEKVCTRCGKHYKGAANSRYCSSECWQNKQPKERKTWTAQCPFCGQVFETDTRKKIYCSAACQKTAASRRRYGGK